MAAMHFLHITDLHLHATPTWEHNVLLDGLRADLEKLRFSQSAPSFVFFSGDIAKAASDPEAYNSVLTYVLDVLNAVGLDESRLIVCPGNHDIDRSIVGANLPDLAKWRQQAATISGANALVGDPKFLSYKRQAFECFDSFAHEFGYPSRTWAGPLSAAHYLRDLGIGVVSLNTASLSGAGLSTDYDDRGSLCVPERAVLEALNDIPPNTPVIVLGHHPLNWLNDANAGMLETILAKRAVAYLHGHLHESRPRNVHGISGAHLAVQSGALYSSRDYWNGYGIISLDLEKGMSRVAYRRWFEQRREFARAEDIGEDGTFYGSDASKAFWTAVTPASDPVALERWRQSDLLPELKADYTRFIADENGSDPFVEPSFDREVPFLVEAEGRVGSRLEMVSYASLRDSSENFVISASAETGKTTLLKHLAVDICTAPATDRDNPASIPVVVSFSAVRAYSSYIETLIRQKLPELPDGNSVKSLLSTGRLCLIFDDVDFSQSEKRNALTSFIANHPKCRYLFTSSTVFVESSALRPEIVPTVPFTRVRLRNIENRQLLSLIENHGTTDPLKADQMLSRVLRDASALNVPLTAVTGTFLIQILISDPDHTILNQAALIERYLEMLLEKYAPRELLPGTFDFRNKVDLLSYVAEQMVKNNEYAPLENTIITWCISYLKGYGLNFSARDLVSYFIEARIFDKTSGHVTFRLKMFFEFFVATRMIEEQEFRDFVFDSDNYLYFGNEIGFYSALHRKDRDQLSRIYGNFESLGVKTFSASRGIADENEFFENLVVPDRETTEAEISDIQRQIASPEQIKKDREELLGDDCEDSALDQTIVKRSILTDEETWTSHLWLLSRMIKHMELIPNADKRRLLSGILQGWVRFAANSMSIAGTLAKDRKVVFHGVTYISTLPDNIPIGEVARRIVLTMPMAVARMAANLLGTEKLREQLEEGLGTDSEPPTRQLIRLAILADIGTPDIAGPATKVASSLRGHTYLRHALARKLYEVAVRFRLPRDEIHRIQALVGTMFADMEHLDATRGSRRKAGVIGTLAKQRLLLSQSSNKSRGGSD